MKVLGRLHAFGYTWAMIVSTGCHADLCWSLGIKSCENHAGEIAQEERHLPCMWLTQVWLPAPHTAPQTLPEVNPKNRTKITFWSLLETTPQTYKTKLKTKSTLLNEAAGQDKMCPKVNSVLLQSNVDLSPTFFTKPWGHSYILNSIMYGANFLGWKLVVNGNRWRNCSREDYILVCSPSLHGWWLLPVPHQQLSSPSVLPSALPLPWILHSFLHLEGLLWWL